MEIVVDANFHDGEVVGVAALSGERRAVSLSSNYFYLQELYHKDGVCQLFFYLFYCAQVIGFE